ncbi:MAG: N-acetylmuramoyl-L-alanine amidase [Gemmatimonadales bacterium]|nr:N-acetylmuramoyl-L-alanine amidase [Gemmatimonadales bacterium]MDQ3427861.1 N-acetylmuramoyl-L-alanine amidase [Gemmatimonadota bacterium]
MATATLMLLAFLGGMAPEQVTVAGAKGDTKLPVRLDGSGAPVLAAAPLLAALSGSVRIADGWAEVTVARQPFRFLVGAPLYVFSSQLQPLAGSASLAGDSLFLPLQFVAELLPYYLAERYRYDQRTATLKDTAARATARGTSAARETRLANGLRPGHIVTVDPGHGGVDPGNPGTFFPKGVREKDVTLQIGVLLREELRRRGVGVRMTRATDTLIALGDRGGYCSEACDLFVSLHVNSLAKRRRYTEVRGFETFFLAEARTEDAARVAKMENDAVRFETGQDDVGVPGGLDFILKDLQLNEHLRESARAAELVQRRLATVHPGHSRGVKQAGFMVLTTARRPAILVELGYSTNPQDGRLLTTRASQRKLASALADAIVEYLRDYERKVGMVSPGAPR